MSEPADTVEDNRKSGKKPKRKKVKRVWWQRKRYILLVLFVGFYGWPIVNPFSPQDWCEFGTGSLDLHRQMKKEARAYLWKNGRVWLRRYSHDAGADFSKKLGAQIYEFAMKRPTATERTAALHSLLRAYDMEFRQNRPTKSALNDGSLLTSYRFFQTYQYQSLNYALNPLCPFCYLLKFGGFGASTKRERAKINDFSIQENSVFLRLFLTTDWSVVAEESSGLSCPEVLR